MDILERAVAAAAWPHGLRCWVVDGRLAVGDGRAEQTLDPVYARTVSRALLPSLLAQLEARGAHSVLVTEYVNPAIAESLAAKGAMFIDTVGNASLKLPHAVVHIVGLKPTKLPVAPAGGLKKSAVKLVFALLLEPRLLEANYRTIADAAGVSLGSVANVLDQLVAGGYMLNTQDRQLLRTRELIDAWTTGYLQHLRPSCLKGRYATEREDWWQDIELDEGMLWAGEVAAHKLTSYLHPGGAAIYAENPQRLILKGRLRKDDNGPIHILAPFWGELTVTGPIAPPLLVYAELAGSASDRVQETAQRLLEEHVLPSLQRR